MESEQEWTSRCPADAERLHRPPSGAEILTQLGTDILTAPGIGKAPKPAPKEAPKPGAEPPRPADHPVEPRPNPGDGDSTSQAAQVAELAKVPNPMTSSDAIMVPSSRQKWASDFKPAVEKLNQDRDVLDPENARVKAWINKAKDGVEQRRATFKQKADDLIHALAEEATPVADAVEKFRELKQAFPPDVPQDKIPEDKRLETSLPTDLLSEVPEYINAKRLYVTGYDKLKAGGKEEGGLKPDYEVTDSKTATKGDHFVIKLGNDRDGFVGQLVSNVSGKVTKYESTGKVVVVADATQVPWVKNAKSTDDIQAAVTAAAGDAKLKDKLEVLFVVGPYGNVYRAAPQG
ncbi:hypothetical protein [Streptomyces rimosus]|uniref:hypothetical protein n=1 Tax=Streptomyces rimosus TaxID=1927 RepID=UPI001331A1D7|nr:hypothetical protein [Streptomyces rimosus]